MRISTILLCIVLFCTEILAPIAAGVYIWQSEHAFSVTAAIHAFEHLYALRLNYLTLAWSWLGVASAGGYATVSAYAIDAVLFLGIYILMKRMSGVRRELISRLFPRKAGV